MGRSPGKDYISISFSELSQYLECPYRYKLDYVLGMKTRTDSPNMAYGRAMHSALGSTFTMEVSDAVKLFEERLVTEMEKLEPGEFDVEDARIAGRTIVKKYYHGEDASMDLVELERELLIDVWKTPSGETVKFRGFIDAVLGDPARKKIHLIDYKTANNGWNSYKKNDVLKHLQLLLYKRYFSELTGIPLSSIDCRFVVLGTGDRSIVDVPIRSDEDRVQAASALLVSVLENIYEKKLYEHKNLDSCMFCDWRDKREYCDRKPVTNPKQFVSLKKLLKTIQ